MDEIINSILNFFSNFFSVLFSALEVVLTWFLNGFITVIGLTVYYIFDGLLLAVYGLVSLIDFGSDVFNFAGTVAGLPSQFLYVCSVIGVGESLVLLGSAYGIRILLNLIPAAFTRI